MTTQSFTTENLQTLLVFPFKDDNWKNKFLIGSLITIGGFVIPLIPFILLYGYMVQIMRHIIVEQGEPLLPEWDDWNKLLLDGLKLFGVILIYMLPIMLLLFVGMSLFFIPFAAGIPFMSGLEENGGETAGLILALTTTIGMLGLTVIYGLAFILMMALGVVIPAIIGHVVATDDFGAAFRLREWWSIFRANLAGFLIAYAIVMALSIVLSFVFMVIYLTMILCCLLPIIIGPITMYTITIYGAVFAQAYRDGAQMLKNQTSVVQA